MINPTEGLTKIIHILKKYKHAVWILVIGIGLFLLPNSTKKTEVSDSVPQNPHQLSASEYSLIMEERLESVLSQIYGVGEVDVILTLKQGEYTHYLSDRSGMTVTKEEGTTVEESEKTVIVSQGNSYDEPIVTRKDYPIFQGALIVCEGGGDAEVKLQLTQAVAALTNLSSHNITILKMK